jgi:hypothetical protein
MFDLSSLRIHTYHLLVLTQLDTGGTSFEVRLVISVLLSSWPRDWDSGSHVNTGSINRISGLA